MTTKHTLTALLASLALLLHTGCVAVNFNMGYSGDKQVKYGEGALQPYEYPVEAYTAIDLDIDLELVYRSAASNAVTLEIQPNLVDDVVIGVQNGTLVVKSDYHLRSRGTQERARLIVSTPDLRAVTARGGLILGRSDTIQGEAFSLSVSGGVDGWISVDVQELELSLMGGASITADGRAQHLALDISGAGAIHAYDLQTQTAGIILSGAGSAEISCSDELDVVISGAGTVSYRGDPSISQTISGVGSLVKAR